MSRARRVGRGRGFAVLRAAVAVAAVAFLPRGRLASARAFVIPRASKQLAPLASADGRSREVWMLAAESDGSAATTWTTTPTSPVNPEQARSPIAAAATAVAAAVLVVAVALGCQAAFAVEMTGDGQQLSTTERLLMEARKPKAPDGPAPVLSEEEIVRRRTSPSSEVANDVWYQRGSRSFVAKCASCHPAGTNIVKRSKSLFMDDLTRTGYDDPDKMMEIIKYGKGTMAGYAKDCAEQSGVYKCGVIVPLSEETLQDLRDFVLNRARVDWSGRG